jgi:hypothetical protein
MHSRQLQEHLADMRTVPLPLSRDEAVRRAVLLRRKHYSFGHIAKVMADYHGVHQGDSWWRKACLKAGAPLLYPERRIRERRSGR